jgi:hypothetical protein
MEQAAWTAVAKHPERELAVIETPTQSEAR